MEYQIRFEDVDGNPIDSLVIAANGGFSAGDSNNVVAVLEKAVEGTNNYSALKGQTLTLTTVGYVDAAFVDGVAKTDKNGEAEFEVVSEVAGDFKVIAKWGKTKATLDVKVVPTGAADVVVNAEPAAPVNIENEVVKAGVEFKFTDANGSASYDANEITLVEKPANSKLKSENFFLASDDERKDGVFDLAADKDFDKEGTYKVRVALENGASATATIKVAEMGDVVGIMFHKAPVSVAYNAVTKITGQAVLAVDAAGVTDGTITGVKYSVSGKAVKAFDANTGIVTMQDEEDFIGQTITVYAVYEVAGETFTTSNTLKVIDSAAGVKYTAKDAEVAVNNKLNARIFDANGNVVTLPTANVKVIVLDQPKDAVVVATATYAAKTGITVNLLASQAGDYELQTIVTYNDGAAERYISDIETITVGAGNKTFKDVVVMSIGANNIVVNSDVKAIAAAPMIQDGRTFVPFRALAEAFGANVAWDEATQSVTAELNGVKVVMVIGANEYTVNGVAKTADVAPFINGASTMVPVRFVAEAFGITVTPTYDDNGATADILFAK
jgi:hypothetical protein